MSNYDLSTKCIHSIEGRALRSADLSEHDV